MLRNEWKFTYPVTTVLAAIEKRVTYHAEQIERIKGDIERTNHAIDHLGDMRSPLHFIHDAPERVAKQRELSYKLRAFNESLRGNEKVIEEFARWKRMLNDNSNESVALDVDDWNYFFGD